MYQLRWESRIKATSINWKRYLRYVLIFWFNSWNDVNLNLQFPESFSELRNVLGKTSTYEFDNCNCYLPLVAKYLWKKFDSLKLATFIWKVSKLLNSLKRGQYQQIFYRVSFSSFFTEYNLNTYLSQTLVVWGLLYFHNLMWWYISFQTDAGPTTESEIEVFDTNATSNNKESMTESQAANGIMLQQLIPSGTETV